MRTVILLNKYASTSPHKDSEKTSILNDNDGTVHTYYLTNHRHSFHKYTHFRFILKPDGSMWHDGTLFMFYKIKANPGFSDARFSTYEQALREFIAFCEESGTDYKNPIAEYDAPTDRFKRYLIATKRSASTGEKLMPVITAFYEWMMEMNGMPNHLQENQVPLWREIKYKSHKTQYRGSEYTTVKNVCKFDGNNQKSDGIYIYDGGKLRPLTREEEIIILKTVNEIGNPEFQNIFHLALMTYARKQTLLTLRLYHILNALDDQKIDSLPTSLEDVKQWKQQIKWPEDKAELKMRVGAGADADVKGGTTTYTITIRGWLWKRIVTYMISERAFKRRALARPQKTELNQYLFLTDKGNAMYHAKSDVNYHNIKALGVANLHYGNALDQFMTKLHSRLKSKGHNIKFHFHCLRATGGVRFLENRASDKKSYANRSAWLMDVQALQKLLNHRDISSTWHYLEYLYKGEKIPETIEKADQYTFDLMSLYDSEIKNWLNQ